MVQTSQTITASNFTKEINDSSFSIGAKTSGNGKLSYSSDNKSVASVSSKGKVTIKGAGIAHITITADATSKYEKAKKTITVNPKSTTISSLKNSSKGKSQFNSATTYVINSKSTVSKTISVTKGKTYYVRICTFKGKMQSSWSKSKKLKIKK